MSAGRDDSPAALMGDAEVLHDAMAILRARFPNHKYDDTAVEVRRAAVHLISIARHPSRQQMRGGRMYVPPPAPEGVEAEREKASRLMEWPQPSDEELAVRAADARRMHPEDTETAERIVHPGGPA